MATEKPPPRKCSKRKKNGQPCAKNALTGLDACRHHCGIAPAAARARGEVVREVMRWGLGDSNVDAGVVMLRLVSQSSARCEYYADLLGQAHDAAERLRAAAEAESLILAEPEPRIGVLPDGGTYERPEHAALQVARADMQRIFNSGGVAALVGLTYTSTKDGDIFSTGEAIRGLAKLESDERDRCAGFAAKAVAAGIAERQVRLAERQGELLAGVIRKVLGDLGLSPEQAAIAAEAVPRHLRVAATAA
jgi:hypothetical protein